MNNNISKNNNKKNMASEMRKKNKEEMAKIQKYEAMGIQVGRLYASNRLPLSN